MSLTKVKFTLITANLLYNAYISKPDVNKNIKQLLKNVCKTVFFSSIC